MKPSRKIIIIPGLLAIAALFYFIGDVRSSRLRNFDPQAYLEKALIGYLPSGIYDLQGIGETWQGENCFFRFHGDIRKLENHLIERGFERHQNYPPEEQLERTIFLRAHTPPANLQDYFDPRWNPDYGKNHRYYIRNNPDGSHSEVLLPAENKWIHVWLGSS